MSRPPKFGISYGQSGAMLTTFDGSSQSDYDYGLSDSYDEDEMWQDNILNWDEIGENSDSLAESVGNSDALEESDGNSDTADINVLE